MWNCFLEWWLWTNITTNKCKPATHWGLCSRAQTPLQHSVEVLSLAPNFWTYLWHLCSHGDHCLLTPVSLHIHPALWLCFPHTIHKISCPQTMFTSRVGQKRSLSSVVTQKLSISHQASWNFLQPSNSRAFSTNPFLVASSDITHVGISSCSDPSLFFYLLSSLSGVPCISPWVSRIASSSVVFCSPSSWRPSFSLRILATQSKAVLGTLSNKKRSSTSGYLGVLPLNSSIIPTFFEPLQACCIIYVLFSAVLCKHITRQGEAILRFTERLVVHRNPLFH